MTGEIELIVTSLTDPKSCCSIRSFVFLNDPLPFRQLTLNSPSRYGTYNSAWSTTYVIPKFVSFHRIALLDLNVVWKLYSAPATSCQFGNCEQQIMGWVDTATPGLRSLGEFSAEKEAWHQRGGWISYVSLLDIHDKSPVFIGSLPYVSLLVLEVTRAEAQLTREPSCKHLNC